MAYRFTWLAVAAFIAAALARLNRLISPSSDGIPWQLVVVGGALVAAVLTWTAVTYGLRTRWVIVTNTVVLTIAGLRLISPETMWAVIPTWDTISAASTEMSYAGDVIRSGSAPVLPSTGLVVVLVAVFWGLGSLAVWGLRHSRPFVALVPPLGLYLYLATVDRVGLELGWVVVLLILVGLGLTAVALDERTAGVGRIKGAQRGSIGGAPVWSIGIVASVTAAAIVATATLGSAVPSTGVVDWRYQRGLTGSFYGSISYNPFISVQKSLINPTNTPVFVARTDGDVPADELYWKLLTMDTFNGVWWYASDPPIDVLEGSDIEDPGNAFAGPTTSVTQDITILALSMEWLPHAYAASELAANDRQVEAGIRVTPDGSLRFGSLTFNGMTYRVTSDVPQPELSALALDAAGDPTPAFADAVADGVFVAPAPVATDVRAEPPNVDSLTELPDELDPRVGNLASQLTRGLGSDYERALALESFLRDRANGFRYNTTVAAGGSTDDLGVWLFDTTSPDYRAGYCEQYANLLAVMGRSIGIPSRVILGFTPGDDLGDGRVVVRDNNAHAWVEFWMPTQGWVRFDATPRTDGVNFSEASTLPFDIAAYLEVPPQPQVDASGLPLPPPQLEGDIDLERFAGAGESETTGTGFELPAWVAWALPVLLIVALVALALPGLKALRRRRRMTRFESGDISAAWHEITDRLSDLGQPPKPSHTPAEFAAATHRSLQPLAAVYAEAVYGPDREMAADKIEQASVSYSDTARMLTGRFSPMRRMAAGYSLRSLRRPRKPR